MKKGFAAAVAILCIGCPSVTAFADTDLRASISADGILSVNITSNTEKEQRYTAYLYENDTALSSSVGTADISGMLRVEQAELKPSPRSEFSNAQLSVNVSDISKGSTYKLTVGGGELDGKTLTLVYPDGTDDMLEKLKLAEAGEITQILNDGQNDEWSLDLSNEAYTSDKNKVCANMAALIAENPNGNVNEWFDTACALSKISASEESEIFSNLSRYENLLNAEYTDEIKSGRDSIAAAFVNLRKNASENPLTNKKEFANLLAKAEALGVLNDATRENVIDVLKKYNDVFELDFDGDFKDVDPYDVAKEMTAGNTPYTSTEAVGTKFSSAVKTAEKSDKDDRNNGSGGGGGAFGGGISSAVTSEIVESVNDRLKFLDISEAVWAEPYIVYMQDRGVLAGDGDGRVRPNDPVKREEFLKMLVTAFSLKADGEAAQSFADVSESDWCFEYVKTASALKIVNGISETEFGTGAELTRQDAAVMIKRAADIKEMVLSETAEASEFADSADIADYAKQAVALMQRAEIISGYENGVFLPNNSITRAECAKLLYSVLKNVARL